MLETREFEDEVRLFICVSYIFLEGVWILSLANKSIPMIESNKVGCGPV